MLTHDEKFLIEMIIAVHNMNKAWIDALESIKRGKYNVPLR